MREGYSQIYKDKVQNESLFIFKLALQGPLTNWTDNENTRITAIFIKLNIKY